MAEVEVIPKSQSVVEISTWEKDIIEAEIISDEEE